MILAAQTLTVSVACDPHHVAAFIANPANLPRWAAGLGGAVRETPSGWVVDTAQGEAGIRFAPPNEFGVVDHEVQVSPNHSVFVPMRVVANGTGSEVIFTLFRQPGMDAARFAADQDMVRADLQRLKAVLEENPHPGKL